MASPVTIPASPALLITYRACKIVSQDLGSMVLRCHQQQHRRNGVDHDSVHVS